MGWGLDGCAKLRTVIITIELGMIFKIVIDFLCIGDKEKDCDIPTNWEGHYFTNTLLKLIWLILQPAFYAIRPLVVRPKIMRTLDLCNTVTIICTNALFVYMTGSYSMVIYLISSTALGMGLHPVAGHFISGKVFKFRCRYLK